MAINGNDAKNARKKPRYMNIEYTEFASKFTNSSDIMIGLHLEGQPVISNDDITLNPML